MNRDAKFIILLFCLVLFSLPLLSKMVEADSSNPSIRLTAGGHSFEVEVAATFDIRNKGLMHRRILLSNHGMLFVFPETDIHCMWMRNTNIPLSVAFVDDRGTITNIEDMKPHTDDYHCASRPVRYAIEMKSGWFHDRGIIHGAHISGLNQAPIGQ